MTHQPYELQLEVLKNELEQVWLPVAYTETHKNGEQRITDILFHNQYVRRIAFVHGKGYYEVSKENPINVYCAGGRKEGVFFKTYKELAQKLLKVNNSFFQEAKAEIPSDLYIHKSLLADMQKGEIGTGYLSVPEEELNQYELISKHAFIPGAQKLDNNSYNVVFILE